MKYSITKLKNGFTLIELLVVIVVIGILAAGMMAITNPGDQFKKANDSRKKIDLAQIQKALEIYYQDNGSYPKNYSSVDFRIKGMVNGTPAPIPWGGSWAPYMGNLPKDPNSSKSYVYVSDGQTYYIYASLDRGGNDPQACFPNGNPCSSAVTNGVPTTCRENCNYGVSSPNVSP